MMFVVLLAVFFAGGSNTWSITWIMPFDVLMSAFTTLDLLIIKVLPLGLI